MCIFRDYRKTRKKKKKYAYAWHNKVCAFSGIIGKQEKRKKNTHMLGILKCSIFWIIGKKTKNTHMLGIIKCMHFLGLKEKKTKKYAHAWHNKVCAFSGIIGKQEKRKKNTHMLGILKCSIFWIIGKKTKNTHMLGIIKCMHFLGLKEKKTKKYAHAWHNKVCAFFGII